MSDTSARATILSAVRAARPPGVVAPPLRPAAADAGNFASRIEAFNRAAVITGAAVVTCQAHEVTELLRATVGSATMLSYVAGVASTAAPATEPHALRDLAVFACSATLGVAENGALWIATSDVMHRAGLFLAQRVIIVVAAENIVDTLHDAYDRIDISATSFGTFVAGPSKTADIEQAMVIGAHGPKELTVIVIVPVA
ncbi:LUD domain-containing protein [soil metagenome]